jgi:hypothetical protein
VSEDPSRFYSYAPPWCEHRDLTPPDEDGFVICRDCLHSLRRPESLDELLKKIDPRY